MAQVAYSLGERCEQEGDADGAARWFRRAAEAGCPDAALRLGDLLGRLADERGPATGDSPEFLLAEAARWFCEARSAARPDRGVPEAIGRVTDMLDRHQRLAARRGRERLAAR
ncbi:hypothetical protein HKK72_36785 [Actinomadura sp. HBU206391]|nr:hypothetical protein [Actinomadura sp. HBU206391]